MNEKLVEEMLTAYESILSACFDTHKDLRVNKLLAMEHALRAIDASRTHCILPVGVHKCVECGSEETYLAERWGANND